MVWARAGFVHVDQSVRNHGRAVLGPAQPLEPPALSPCTAPQLLLAPQARPSDLEHQCREDKTLDFQSLHIINCLEFKNKRTCWEVYA